MSEKDTDKAMQDIAMRAILARPLVYARDVLHNAFAIFLADTSLADESLEEPLGWVAENKIGWREQFRRFVVAADPRAAGSLSVPGRPGQPLSAGPDGGRAAGAVSSLAPCSRC